MLGFAIEYIKKRFRERSTHLAIAAMLLTGLAAIGLDVPEDSKLHVTETLALIFASLAALVPEDEA